MAEIITYNNPSVGNSNKCYCQMKFDDGVRILISQSNNGITIYKLFYGIIPFKKLFQASFIERDKHKLFINTNSESPLLLDSYVETIKSLNNSKQLLKLLNDG